ncbi:MAG: condensation domain-containing protein, partial [Actinomycetota bacterium]|nr:condensation domain-containing protein [Actinomycetota bacterium]
MTSSKQSRRDALPEHLRAQLARRLAGRTDGSVPAVDVIPPAPVDGQLPLSSAQRRLWFLTRFTPGANDYNSGTALRFTGSLDAPRLIAAIGALVARHASLRTTFDEVDGEPTQTVHEPSTVDVPVLERTSDELDEVLSAEFARPFDLRTGPLLRAALVRTPQDHVLLLSSHHIAVDGWSWSVLTEELATLYAGGGLSAPGLAYTDFAVWQQGRLTGPAMDEHLAYWRDRLAGATTLDLPTDRPRPSVRGSAGSAHHFVLSGGLSRTVVELARANDTTVYTTLLAACQILLAKYSGQTDITIGTVTSGRGRPELNRVAGFFVNTVVLRSTVDLRRSFTDFLAEVNRDALSAFSHDEVPFDRLVDAVEAPRDPSRNPLFDVLVLLQNAQRGLPSFQGVDVAEVDLRRWAANFDLSFEFTERPGHLECVLEYSTELFKVGTIERMAGHLVTLIAGATATPDRSIADLPMLTTAEHRAITRDWNDTAMPVPATTFPAVFAAQAARTPDQVALVCDGEVLTYAELNARANRLAHLLADKGARPERVVAVALPRSADAVVAQLAVLKAGAVYLPIDPALPSSRRASLVSDSGAVMLLDQMWDTAGQPETDPDVELRPDNAAYVIYTSGSTGKPKGVTVEHRNLVNLLHNHRADFVAAVGGGRLRVALSAVFSFDTSWEGPVL